VRADSLNLLDFLLILAFIGAMQSMFASIVAVCLHWAVVTVINRSRVNGR